jgi:hypothetical protein
LKVFSLVLWTFYLSTLVTEWELLQFGHFCYRCGSCCS